MTATNLANAIEFDFENIEDAFPAVKHGRVPLLTNYIVQVRRAKQMTKSGIYIPEESRKSEAANCTVGKVVAISPNCFKNADGTPWHEGPSFKVGNYLQIPRFGGFRFSVRWKDEEIDFVIFDHLQQLAEIEGDPRKITNYL